MNRIPDSLLGRPFRTAEALAIGVTRRQLQGPYFVQVHRGIWVSRGTPLSLEVLVRADLLGLPDDACVSHRTALQWYGVNVGAPTPRHYSTNSQAQTGLADVVLHRRRGQLHPRDVRGLRVVGPDRALVDSATQLDRESLVRAADALIRAGLTAPGTFADYASVRHIDGVARARAAAPLVRSRVDSVKETDVRLMIRAGGLPEPEVNTSIRNDAGEFVARGDLPYPRWKVLVEYDGWHHDRSAEQRQNDIERRERLDASGWAVVTLTAADLDHPARALRRIWEALRRRGYPGPPPVYNREALRFLRNA